MSLETALDDERREVMDILEGRPSHNRDPGNRSASPFAQNERMRSPPAPVRSMLDIAGPAKSPRAQTVRSMLDTDGPVSTRSAQGAITSTATASGRPPAGSDALQPRPRATMDREAVNPHVDYQFQMLPTIQNQALPKRVTQGGKKQNIGSMASIMQGQELGPIPRGRDQGRHNSTAGIGRSSTSPSSRLLNRSQSPGTGTLMKTPGKFVTDSGKVIDMNNAFRRLSDAALIKSGGGLSNLPTNNVSQRVHLGTGESLSPTGEVRLQKDYYPRGGNGERVIESSDEDPHSGSSDEELLGQRSGRGRKRGRRKTAADEGDLNNERSDSDGVSVAEGSVGLGKSPGPRKAKSLLAAAEEERVKVSGRYKVRSLLEPTVTVTGPGGEKLSNQKVAVHPNTNYDPSISVRTSSTDSDSEELGNIRHAQSLAIKSTPIDSSIPHRVIKTILRGDFARMQREAEEGIRRLRTYLVATDLSDEAAYALEWTIGTVLRDGDTLLAVYAVGEETGTAKDAESPYGLSNGEGIKAMQETTALVEKMTLATQNLPLTPGVSSPMIGAALGHGSGKNSSAGSADSRHLTKAEQERIHAIQSISDTCIKYLRKTKLQVRIAIEAIHCKSPKHMITEAIDGLEPTLVVLGSRGRSALKGVLLGSFSNYLVTKSSVPVMVVRKKLAGRKAKHVSPTVRLANNIAPNRLAEAKID